MTKKFSEEPLKDLYVALANDDEGYLKNLHIPHSSVIYAREAYYQHSGEWISLRRMEQAMMMEGMIPNDFVFKKPADEPES